MANINLLKKHEVHMYKLMHLESSEFKLLQLLLLNN